MSRILKKEATGSAPEPRLRWRTSEAAGKHRVCCLSAARNPPRRSPPHLPLAGGAPAGEPGRGRADNPAAAGAGPRALHPYSHPGILPSSQKLKPTSRGAKQITPDTRASNKSGGGQHSKSEGSQIRCRLPQKPLCATAKQHRNTRVSTSRFPLSVTGLGTSGNSRPVCWGGRRRGPWEAGYLLSAVPSAREWPSLFTPDKSPTVCQALWDTGEGRGGSLGPGAIQERGTEPVRSGLC